MTESGVDGVRELNQELDKIPVKLLSAIAKIVNVNARLMQSYIRTEHLTGGRKSVV